MATLIDQLRTVVEKGTAAERDLNQIGEATTQTAQLAYSLNCIWLYAQGGDPKREDLEKALPPLPDGSPETTKQTLDYIRRTLIIIRSLVSEKIESTFKAERDLASFQSILGDALAPQPEQGTIEQLDEDDIEEIVRDVVPAPIRPQVPERPKERKTARKARPWLLT